MVWPTAWLPLGVGQAAAAFAGAPAPISVVTASAATAATPPTRDFAEENIFITPGPGFPSAVRETVRPSAESAFSVSGARYPVSMSPADGAVLSPGWSWVFRKPAHRAVTPAPASTRAGT